MLKITPMQEDNTIARLQIEGHILHQTVKELRAECEARLATHRTLLLEVSGIRFADATGIDLFQDLRQRDVVLVGCSGFLKELLRQNKADDNARSEQTPEDDTIRETQPLQ
jgi:anti-anti-sigma regulatory factor